MKKILIILVMAGLLFALPSCTKKCTCKYYMAENITSEEEVEVGGKNPFKNCNKLQNYYNKSGAGYNKETKTGYLCK